MSHVAQFKRMGRRTLTRKEQVEKTMVEIKAIMEAILGDPLGPTKVLADGKTVWINTFLRAMQGYPGVDREMAEYQWALYEQEHSKRFPGETPRKVLDTTHVVSDPTPKEIRDSFQHDTASSEAMRKEVYGPDGYDIDNAFREAKDSLTDDELKPKTPSIEDIAADLPTLLADVPEGPVH